MFAPEDLAREKIDEKLIAWSWIIQNCKALNSGASRGIAIREVTLQTGPRDYMLLVDRKPVGLIEAKKAVAHFPIDFPEVRSGIASN